MAEAVEKTRRQASEERQRLLVEAHQQVRDAVAAVRAEIEQKMQQAQSGAIQEALKEANVQTNSKEVRILLFQVIWPEAILLEGILTGGYLWVTEHC